MLQENDSPCTYLCPDGNNVGNNVHRAIHVVLGSPACAPVPATLILREMGFKTEFLTTETASPIFTFAMKSALCHDVCCLQRGRACLVPSRALDQQSPPLGCRASEPDVPLQRTVCLLQFPRGGLLNIRLVGYCPNVRVFLRWPWGKGY